MRLKNTITFLILGFILGGSSVFAEEAGHDHKTHATPTTKTASVKKLTKPAHADHTPKHGGQFFMAPNKFHHLEGALPTADEFRVYFYDNHTKPIPANPFKSGAKIGVQKVGPDGREIGSIVDLPVNVDASGLFLTANIPDGLPLPLYFTTYLTFPNQKEADLFNFNFDKVSAPSKRTPSKASSEMKKSGSMKMTMYQCPMKDSPPLDKPGRCPKCGMNMEPVEN